MMNILITGFLAIALSIAVTQYCSTNKMVRTPDKMAKMKYDLVVQRAMEVALWATPAVSLFNIEKSLKNDLGAQLGDLVYFSKPLTSKTQMLTSSPRKSFVLSVLNLKEGPIVFEIPKVENGLQYVGVVVDAWQRPLVKLNSTSDSLPGLKILFLPPGLDINPPKDFQVYQPDTYSLHVILRPHVNGDYFNTDIYNFISAIDIRRYGEEGIPIDSKTVDASDKLWNSLPNYDLRFFESINAIIQAEAVQDYDKIAVDYLSFLGIEKGNEFNPDKETKKALLEGLERAFYYMQNFFETPGLALRPYWQGSHWVEPNFQLSEKKQVFLFENEQKIQIDKRSGGVYFWRNYFPVSLELQAYEFFSLRDEEGQLFTGNGEYKLHLPANFLVNGKWTLSIYSAQTKSFVQNSKFVSLGSDDLEQMRFNEDGTLDLYLSPTAPRGYGSNWIPTREEFFVVLRVDQPGDEFIHKTWKLENIKKL